MWRQFLNSAAWSGSHLVEFLGLSQYLGRCSDVLSLAGSRSYLVVLDSEISCQGVGQKCVGGGVGCLVDFLEIGNSLTRPKNFH